MTKTIYLPLEMRDARTGGLIPVSKLSEMRIGSLYHELWHAYLDTFAKPRNTVVYNKWLREARTLYPKKGIQFHDEAYGIFLDQIMINYLQLRRIFEKRTPHNRERLRNANGLKKIYEESFHEKVFGYYYSRWTRQFIYSKVNLPESARLTIVRDLLHNRPPAIYAQAYLEEHF